MLGSKHGSLHELAIDSMVNIRQSTNSGHLSCCVSFARTASLTLGRPAYCKLTTNRLMPTQIQIRRNRKTRATQSASGLDQRARPLSASSVQTKQSPVP